MTFNSNDNTSHISLCGNIAETNELNATVRDVTAERRAKGHINTASNFIPDDEANNNSDIVTRDGSRVHAGGDYQPNDLVMIDGMEVTYEMAQSLGIMKGAEFTSPQEDFQQGAEVASEPQPTDDRPAETVLLHDRFELAFGNNRDAALDLLGKDVVENGDISEDGLSFLQQKMGVSEQAAKETYSEMQEVGGQVMAQYLETGDDLGMERIHFLVDLADTGTIEQQGIVRNIWFQAATGKLTRDQAIEAFDYLVEPYER